MTLASCSIGPARCGSKGQGLALSLFLSHHTAAALQSNADLWRSPLRGSRALGLRFASVPSGRLASPLPPANAKRAPLRLDRRGPLPFHLRHRIAPNLLRGAMRWRRRKGRARGMPESPRTMPARANGRPARKPLRRRSTRPPRQRSRSERRCLSSAAGKADIVCGGRLALPCVEV
jgi:hypothetical protein